MKAGVWNVFIRERRSFFSSCFRSHDASISTDFPMYLYLLTGLRPQGNGTAGLDRGRPRRICMVMVHTAKQARLR